MLAPCSTPLLAKLGRVVRGTGLDGLDMKVTCSQGHAGPQKFSSFIGYLLPFMDTLKGRAHYFAIGKEDNLKRSIYIYIYNSGI